MVFDEGPSFEEPGQPYPKDFTVTWTGLVSRTFTLWTRKLIQYIMIAGLPVIIFAVLEFLVLYAFLGSFASIYIGTISSNPLSFILNLFLLTGDLTIMMIIISLTFASVIISSFVAGATYKFAFDNYGSPDGGDVRESFSFTIGKLVPLILMQLIVSGIIMAIMLPGLILMMGSIIAFDLAAIVLGFGVMMISLLISLYVTVRLSVAVVLVITEDNSVIDSLKRAFAMTSGQFWHIFAGQILMGIVVLLLGMVLIVIAIPLALVFGSATIGVLVVAVFIGIISQLFFSPMSYIFGIVLYRDLQSRTSTTVQEWW